MVAPAPKLLVFVKPMAGPWLGEAQEQLFAPEDVWKYKTPLIMVSFVQAFDGTTEGTLVGGGLTFTVTVPTVPPFAGIATPPLVMFSVTV